MAGGDPAITFACCWIAFNAFYALDTLGFACGIPRERRYLRTVFLETPRSLAIPSMERPLPLNSYSSLTNPPPNIRSDAPPVGIPTRMHSA